MPGLTWVNGRFVSPGEPCLEAGERGFLYGDGLFETVRLYDGRPFAWARHADRLAAGCQMLGIPYPKAEIAAGIQAMLAALYARRTSADNGAGSLRLTVTRGSNPAGARGLLPIQGLQPTVVVTAKPGEPYPADSYCRGQRAITVSFPRNHLSPVVRLKSLNYLENLLGRQEAAVAGADEGIFFNLKGELTEGTASNIFLLFDDQELITPPIESGLLPGIAREIVLSIGCAIGLQVRQEVVTCQDFQQIREVWLTKFPPRSDAPDLPGQCAHRGRLPRPDRLNDAPGLSQPRDAAPSLLGAKIISSFLQEYPPR